MKWFRCIICIIWVLRIVDLLVIFVKCVESNKLILQPTINIILCILFLLSYSFLFLFSICWYCFGAFFSSAELLFLLSPCLSSEYFGMNISLICTHTLSIFSCALYLADKLFECVQPSDISECKMSLNVMSHVYIECWIFIKWDLTKFDPDTLCSISHFTWWALRSVSHLWPSFFLDLHWNVFTF